MAERRAREILVFCAVGLAVALGAAATGLAWGEDAPGGWQLAARYTARVAFPPFLALFVASSWQRLSSGSVPRWLVRHRRALGLAFATMFTVHLVCLTAFSLASGTVPEPTTLVVGGGAFVALYALVLTSTDGAVRRLGVSRWRRLHTFGVYYLWFIYTFTYAGRLASAPGFFAPFALACVLGLAVRLVGRRRGGSTRQRLI